MAKLSDSRGDNPKAERPSQAVPKAALEQTTPLSSDSLKMPQVKSTEEQANKTGYRPEQILELIRTRRLEIATAFGFKGEVLARCAKASALPAEVILRVKPFEDRAKVVLGKVTVCADAVKRLEKALNKSVMYTDVLALAHLSRLKALHPVRDHATTQRFLAAIKGAPRGAMVDRLLSLVSTEHKQRCDMRTVIKVLEVDRSVEKIDSKPCASDF